MAEKQAEGSVMGIGVHTPDGVAGIDVLEVYFLPVSFKVGIDLIPKEQTYIPEADVPRSIPFLRSLH